MSSAQEILMAAAGATPATAAIYIEDVFSTYLYTGNGGTQTITNGLDLSTKGGLVWIKNRTNTSSNAWTDTARGAGTGTSNTATNIISSNSSSGTGGGLPASSNDYLSAFTTTGFTVVSSNGANNSTRITNRSSDNYVSWSFRDQAKFFDIVTYTGTGANRTISHNLGSVPGCIIIKRLDSSLNWQVYHRSLGNTAYAQLNLTNASAVDSTRWNNTSPTSSVFTVGTSTTVNGSGGTYVAYLFAHDAGGFGLTGSDNVISCGSFTGPSATVTLGYEPQWIMYKNTTSATDNWEIYDNMRGLTGISTGENNYLLANTTGLDTVVGANPIITPTGFTASGTSGNTYIYIAIRRGPMKKPTVGTTVYSTATYTGDAVANRQIGTTIVPDLSIVKARTNNTVPMWADRIRYVTTGAVTYSSSTAIEVDPTTGLSGGGQITDVYSQTGIKLLQGTANINNVNQNTITFVNWNFRRAPSFFDTVCYTGTGAAATLNHNLGATPELVVIKGRSIVSNWETYLSSLGGTAGNALAINLTDAKSGTPAVSSATTTTFTLNSGVSTSSGQTYVAYLFATCSGVSKVGSYTGTGALQTVNCGFSSGARFVLIKRTDVAGDWYVYDSARGITSGNDPYLFLGSTATEVTGTNYVDTDTTGFKVTAAAPAALNANGGNFIFLAIA